jgi:rod shape determining protein RodA
MRQQQSIFDNLDWVMVGLYLLLVLLGWFNIYAAVYNEEHSSILDLSQRYGKQLLWIGLSVGLALLVLIIDGKFFSFFAYPIYWVNIGLLLVVLVVARDVSGARAWIDIGPFKLQPAEFMKAGTALALAQLLSELGFDITKWRNMAIAGLLIGLPAVLILAQNDTGSAIVFSTFALVLYREGMTPLFIIIGLAMGIVALLALLLPFWALGGVLAAGGGIAFMMQRRRSLSAALGIVAVVGVLAGFAYSVDYVMENVLEPHQRERISVLIGEETDLKGAGYNVNQSKIAIGSGGFIGKGYLQGTQTKYDFVPEQSTDFIFCTVGEEWGFVGSTVVILLFVALIWRVIWVAERQRSAFSRIYGYCVAAVLFFHFVINIGMAVGLLPVIGIPLPFFSYGGSSLLGFTLLLMIYIRLDGYRLLLLR